jgi:hypothetical protein
MEMSTYQIIFIIILIYGLPTCLALANVDLHPVPKYLFCLTVAPLVFGIFLISFFLIQYLFPNLLTEIMNLPDKVGNRTKSIVLIIFFIPLPLIAIKAWYRVNKLFDNKLRSTE